MRIGGIIFSRMSSSRLPGKAFKDVAGKFLLERVIDRSKKIHNIDHLCVATSDNKDDDKISSYAKSRGLSVYRGSLEDVADRALQACKTFNYDSFLRICADRPFLNPQLYDSMIEIHNKNTYDVTTNIFPRTVPPGLTGEVINVNSLEKLLNKTENFLDREHVTRYFYQNSDNFKIYNCNFLKDPSDIDQRLVIDDSRDLERSRWVVKNLESNSDFDIREIIRLSKEWESKN